MFTKSIQPNHTSPKIDWHVYVFHEFCFLPHIFIGGNIFILCSRDTGQHLGVSTNRYLEANEYRSSNGADVQLER